MDAVAAGKAGLQGWRAKVGDAVAGPVAPRAPFSDDPGRAVICRLFFLLSRVYCLGAGQRISAGG